MSILGLSIKTYLVSIMYETASTRRMQLSNDDWVISSRNSNTRSTSEEQLMGNFAGARQYYFERKLFATGKITHLYKNKGVPEEDQCNLLDDIASLQ